MAGRRLAIWLPIILVIVPLEFGREAIATWLVGFTHSVFGGSTTAMTLAGWATFAFLPLAAAVIDRDTRHRYGQLEARDLTHLTRRERAAEGHGVAARPPSYWLRRAPVLIAVALAVVFMPMRGFATGMVNGWRATVGGAAFVDGWHWSSPMALLGVIVILMAPLISALGGRRARRGPHSRVYAIAATLPLVGLLLALV